MRFFIGAMISMGISSFVYADTNKALQPITDLSEFSREASVNQLEWDNQRPEQQRALNQFYQSVSQSGQKQPSVQREEQVQQLRSMNPQQRQQMFLNYIKQNR
jgi:hypothetical protein